MMAKTGRPPRIAPQNYPLLVELAQTNPLSTQAELMDMFTVKTGISTHPATFAATLKLAGIVRIKPRVKRVFEPPEKRTTYGYNDTHGRQLPEQRYPSCLTGTEWALVADLFEREGHRGKPPRHSRRQLLDACCYVVRTGSSWRMLPREFPHWDNVYKTFRRWSEQGKFEQMHDRLRTKSRQREERNNNPSAAILDAQSTRFSPQGGENGYDAGKKIKGRKRSLIVDTLGLLLAISISAVNVQDRDAATEAMAQTAAEKYPTIKTLFVDSAYADKWSQHVQQTHEVNVQVIQSPDNRNTGQWSIIQTDLFLPEVKASGFVALPKRWVVERTHARNERARLLIMQHDRLHVVIEAWVWLAEARLLARRLTA